MTRTSFIRFLKWSVAILAILLIASYAIWRSLNYIRGPRIEIFEPTNGSSVEASTTTIRGQTKRVNNLTLNGNSLFIDEEGNFSEVIIVFPGVNRITFIGEDRFKRQTSTLLEIVGKVDLPEPRTSSVRMNTSNATTSQELSTTTDE